MGGVWMGGWVDGGWVDDWMVMVWEGGGWWNDLHWCRKAVTQTLQITQFLG